MLEKPIDQIGAADINELLSEETPEGISLEYKQILPGNTDDDKREFLKDVSAMANTAGGYLIYGIAEKRSADGKTGLPERIDGVVGAGDEIQRRLQSIIQTGLAPRIKTETRGVDGFTLGPVIVLRIHRSPAAPHMVCFKQSSRFFVRASTQVVQMDVGELRAAFLKSETAAEKIRQFREQRLAKIVAGEIHGKPAVGAVAVIQVVSMAAWSGLESVDIAAIDRNNKPFLPKFFTEGNFRTNFDGYLCFSDRGGALNQNVQIFRNGAIEVILGEHQINGSKRQELFAPRIASRVLGAIDYCRAQGDALLLSLPLVVMLSILNVRGRYIDDQNYGTDYSIDLKDLIFPEALLLEETTTAEDLMRPIFHALWQSSGYAGCPWYQADGKYIGPPRS